MKQVLIYHSILQHLDFRYIQEYEKIIKKITSQEKIHVVLHTTHESSEISMLYSLIQLVGPNNDTLAYSI